MIRQSIVLTVLIMALHLGYSQEKYNVPRGETLMEGYDPVTYFSGDPKKGISEIFIRIDGRKVHFFSTENREKFALAPEKYTPRYGGWSAMGMADAIFIDPDYLLYKIQDGHLYFFHKNGSVDGLLLWEEDPDGNQIMADLQYARHFD